MVLPAVAIQKAQTGMKEQLSFAVCPCPSSNWYRVPEGLLPPIICVCLLSGKALLQESILPEEHVISSHFIFETQPRNDVPLLNRHSEDDIFARDF